MGAGLRAVCGWRVLFVGFSGARMQSPQKVACPHGWNLGYDSWSTEFPRFAQEGSVLHGLTMVDTFLDGAGFRPPEYIVLQWLGHF